MPRRSVRRSRRLQKSALPSPSGNSTNRGPDDSLCSLSDDELDVLMEELSNELCPVINTKKHDPKSRRLRWQLAGKCRVEAIPFTKLGAFRPLYSWKSRLEGDSSKHAPIFLRRNLRHVLNHLRARRCGRKMISCFDDEWSARRIPKTRTRGFRMRQRAHRQQCLAAGRPKEDVRFGVTQQLADGSDFEYGNSDSVECELKEEGFGSENDSVAEISPRQWRRANHRKRRRLLVSEAKEEFEEAVGFAADSSLFDADVDDCGYQSSLSVLSSTESVTLKKRRLRKRRKTRVRGNAHAFARMSPSPMPAVLGSPALSVPEQTSSVSASELPFDGDMRLTHATVTATAKGETAIIVKTSLDKHFDKLEARAMAKAKVSAIHGTPEFNMPLLRPSNSISQRKTAHRRQSAGKAEESMEEYGSMFLGALRRSRRLLK